MKCNVLQLVSIIEGELLQHEQQARLQKVGVMKKKAFLLCGVFLFVGVSVLFAQRNPTIPYSGYLERDGMPVSGKVDMWVFLTNSNEQPVQVIDEGEERPEFLLWFQQFVDIQISQGSFKIMLGEDEPNLLPLEKFAIEASIYVGVFVRQQASPEQNEAQPWVELGRTKLLSSPHALSAEFAARSKGMKIESDQQFSNQIQPGDIPLYIRDGSDQQMFVDGDDISNFSTLHFQRIPGLEFHNLLTHVHGPLIVNGPLSSSRNDTIEIDDDVRVNGAVYVQGQVASVGGVNSTESVFSGGHKVVSIRDYISHSVSRDSRGSDEIFMGPTIDRFCFLTEVQILWFESYCELSIENDQWKLEIEMSRHIGEDSEMRCEATCVLY